MEAYKVFTISSGTVTEGATIETLRLKGAGVEIPAVIIGEEGYGRERGVIPVDNPDTESRLLFAEVGQTRAGKPKFFVKDGASSDDRIIVVLRTKIGFRGGNDHTGDRVGWKCPKCNATGNNVTTPEACPECGATGDWNAPKPTFGKFPGEIIARGRIAEGAAGRMGDGEQLVAVVPKNTVFRTAYTGRLYGAPSSHYYKWDGLKVISATWNERVTADLF